MMMYDDSINVIWRWRTM